MPERIQLRRTKGWRMPPNTVSVARPSLWSNPWRVARRHGGFVCENTRNRQVIQAKDRSDALDLVLSHYRAWLASRPYTFPAMRGRLGGKNLGCFCALDQPCHADILLEIANA